MTEIEAIERLQTLNIILTNKSGHKEDGIEKIFTFSDITAICKAIQALEEIQQYRAYKEIFENHFSEEALELLSDKEEFGKWLERGKWIVKRCDEINRELEAYRAIGTIEEFKALKENGFFNFDSPVVRVDEKSYNKAIDECIKIIEETAWKDTDMLVESIRELKGGVEWVKQY